MDVMTRGRKRMTVHQPNDIEQRVWELATDKSLLEVTETLSQLPPYVPPTPEIRLQAAIFGRRLMDYRATLVEIFLRLHHPEGDWENYLEGCCEWVTGMLEDAVRFETNHLKEPLHQVLATLPDRLITILSVRFGFDNQGAKTLEQTGKEFNLTKERIRQLEAKALRMLRHPSRSQYLRHVLLGERLRKKLFAEINKSSAYTIFLMWEEDYDLFLSLKKSTEQAAKRKQQQSEDGFPQAYQNPGADEEKARHAETREPRDSEKGESSYNVQQKFAFQDL